MASDENDVGYGKPPKKSQFKKGQSGNPKGRPKGTRNFKTDLEAELQQQVRITEDGKLQNVSKQQAILKRTFEKALNGDIRAVELIGKWCAQYLGTDIETNAAEILNPDDEAIIERFLESRNSVTSSNQKDAK